MRRVRLSIASVVLAFALAVVMSVTSGVGTTYAAGTALSVLVDGVVVSHGGGPFVAAVDGESLHEGDTIRTEGGRAVVTYFEGSNVTIEPNTELTIDATETAPDGGTIVLMTQLVGRTWNVVTKLITGGSRYEIRTPTTTASVRGTKFEVDADGDATTVTTSEGLVVQRVLMRGGRLADVPVRAGMTQTQRRGTPPAPATPSSTSAPYRGTAMADRTAHGSAAGRVVRGHYADASAPGARAGGEDDLTRMTVPHGEQSNGGASGASRDPSRSDVAPPEMARPAARRRG